MHRRTLLCALLLLAASATHAWGTVRHYVFGLDRQTTYDVWQGDDLLAGSVAPGPAGDIAFQSQEVSPVSILPTGAENDVIPPGTVDDLSVTGTTSSSVTLAWTAVGDDGGAGQASVYDVRYATFPINETSWSSATRATGEPWPGQAGEEETFTVSGLSPGTTYYIGLKVGDEIPNWSELSNVAEGTTGGQGGGDIVPPGAVTDLAVAGNDVDRITLTWTAVGDDGGQGQASAYDLRYDTEPITAQSWAAATHVNGEPPPKQAGQTEEIDVAGLSPETTYYFALKVADEVPNWSELSNVAEGTTDTGGGGDTVPPADVDDLAVIDRIDTALLLSWTAVGDDGESGTASQYDLRYDTEPITAQSWDSATQVDEEPDPDPAGEEETFAVYGLSPGTTYYFALKVADEVPNWSGLSNIAEGETSGSVDDTVPPAEVDNLTVVGGTAGSMLLSWSAVGDDGDEGTASVYDLRYDTEPIDPETWDSATQAEGEPNPKTAGQAESFSVGGLEPETTYYFALKVGDEVPNWSGLSNVAEGTTDPVADTIPPADVENLSLLARRLDSILLTWKAVGDDGDEGQATTYDLRYDTEPIDETSWESATPVAGEPDPRLPGQAELFEVTGLESATQYYFALKVGDEVPNWSDLSNVLPASTLTVGDGVPPAAVTNLQVSWTSDRAVALAWTASGDDGNEGQATLYDIRYAQEPIDEESWEFATQVEGEPNPKPAGQAEHFAVGDLEPLTTYHLALRVSDDAGNWSDLSNVVIGATLEEDQTPPADVDDLASEGTTETTVALRWTAVGDDGEAGQAVLYDLRYAQEPIDEETWDSATAVEGEPNPDPAGTEESFTVEGLAAETTYHFALKVRDESFNWSGLSNEAQGTTLPAPPDGVPPGGVDDLSVFDVAQHSVTLSWTATGDDGENGRASAYDVRCSQSPIDESNWDDAIPCEGEPPPGEPGETEYFVDSELQANTHYYFALKVGDDAGNWSGISNLVSATTHPVPDVIAPTVIDDISAENIRHRSLQLVWTAPHDDEETEACALYEGRYDTEPIDAESWDDTPAIPDLPTPSAPGQLDSVLVPGLEPGATYYFAIRARDEAGNLADLGAVLEATTTSAPDDAPPHRISDLVAGPATMTTITLRWHAPADSIPPDCLEDPRVDRYDLRFASFPLDSANWEQGAVVEAPVPSEPGALEEVVVTGLLPETTYYFAVRAIDARENAATVSPSVEGSTLPPDELPDTIAPAMIRDLSVLDVAIEELVLAWTAPGDDGNDGQAAYYDLRRSDRPLDGDAWDEGIPILPHPECRPAGEAETLRVDGLDPETTYFFAVRAVDGAGNRGPVSPSLEAATLAAPDTTPPAVVTDLAVAEADTISILLTWTAPGDDRGICAAYELRYSTGPLDEETWEEATSAGALPPPSEPGEPERFRVDGLEPATAYTFALRAVDAAGNVSSPSNRAEASTASPPDPGDVIAPARIEDLAGNPVGQTQAMLTWTAVGDDGSEGTATRYELRRSTGPIDATNWAEAIPVAIDVEPAAAGETESFVVGGLAEDTEHHFSLRAVDESGNRSPCSPDAMVRTPPPLDTNAPTAPEEIDATDADDRIVLRWSPSPDPDVVEYVLYRRETSPGSNESVAFLDLEGTEYVDALVLPDVEYAYTVEAVDAAGNHSARSPEVLVRTRLEGFLPVIEEFGADAIVETVPEEGESRVHLSWSATSGDRFAGFVVERSEDEGETWAARTQGPITGDGPYHFLEPIDPGSYLYRICAVSPRGYRRPFEPIRIRFDGPAAGVRIDGPFPNPAPAAVTLRFELPQRGTIRIGLYDPSGRRVAVLRNETVEAGIHSWSFEPSREEGGSLSSGLYFLRIETAERSEVRKLIIRR
ncbi:MAG: T9SS type A sorting domain-containing protein [Candidatus Eisenbacteria bacterium]|nr:T9SS type A sorting domain-containing protein [Candidatus Latescibacterota bacterium]MBD3303319.1 T9SS type A sorting domain-containing protein [Candidatus Eisenbacteria bacterium]